MSRLILPALVPLALMAAQLGGCTADVGSDALGDCHGDCDWTPQWEPNPEAPVVLECRSAPVGDVVYCSFFSYFDRPVIVEHVIIDLIEGGESTQTASVGPVLPFTVFPLSGDPAAAEIAVRYDVDVEESSAIGASRFDGLQQTHSLEFEDSGELVAKFSLPVKISTVEIFGEALFSDVYVTVDNPEIDIGTAVPEELFVDIGQRRSLQIATRDPEDAIRVTASIEDEQYTLSLDGSAMLKTAKHGLAFVDDEELPIEETGTVGLECAYSDERLQCALPDDLQGVLGKALIKVTTAHGFRSFYVSERFGGSFELPRSYLPARIDVELEALPDVVGLPPHRRFNISKTLTEDGAMDAHLPFEIWRLDFAADANLTSVAVAPYEQNYGRTHDGWYRYVAAPEFYIPAATADDPATLFLAVPVDTDILSARIKTSESSGYSFANLRPGIWSESDGVLTPEDDETP